MSDKSAKSDKSDKFFSAFGKTIPPHPLRNKGNKRYEVSFVTLFPEVMSGAGKQFCTNFVSARNAGAGLYRAMIPQQVRDEYSSFV